MSKRILTADTDQEKIAFMKSALAAICEHLEGGFNDSAHSIAKTCLVGMQKGLHSPEFISLLTLEKARLNSFSGVDE